MKKILGIAGCCIALLMMLSINGVALENANAVEIPGKIDAKSYTFFSGTDTQETTDEGEGSDVFWIKNNDWFSYIINVTKEGLYQIDFHVAGNTDGGNIFLLSNEEALSEIEFTNTGDRESLQTVTTQAYLKEGEQTIYLLFQSDDTEAMFNLSHMMVSEIMPIGNSRDSGTRSRDDHISDRTIYRISSGNKCDWPAPRLELSYGYSQGMNVYVDAAVNWNRTQSEWRLHWNGWIDGEPTWRLLSNRGWSERTLDVQGAGTESGANVQVYPANGTKAQAWVIYPTSKPKIYYIKSKCSGKFLDRSGAGCDSGTNVHQWWKNGTAAQEWLFLKD